MNNAPSYAVIVDTEDSINCELSYFDDVLEAERFAFHQEKYLRDTFKVKATIVVVRVLNKIEVWGKQQGEYDEYH